MKFLSLYRIAVYLCLSYCMDLTRATEDMSPYIPPRDYARKEYFMIELEDQLSLPGLIENLSNWTYEHQSRAFEKYHVFSLPKGHDDLLNLGNYESDNHSLIKREDNELFDSLLNQGLKSIHMLPSKRLTKRAPVPIGFPGKDSSQEKAENVKAEFGIDDPIFTEQWHIINSNFPGHDVNVVPVWQKNITGYGVVTALVDDGLDYESKDLATNFCAEGSWDYNDNNPLPKPRLYNDYHGTRCAAEIAAEKGNGFCGVGVAYNSKVSGIRILSADITAEDEATAMIHALDVNDIYSCSWGPQDNGRSMDAPAKVVKEAMVKGILDGRDSKGALYVFASGNGAMRGDSCNFDGYTNSIYSMTITAIDHKGLYPTYAEACTAVMVTTYSSGSGEHIHTTDFKDKCTADHGGTSAAAPLAAGIYALVLEANPNLTWRDVQYLSVLGAAEVSPEDASWQDTAIEGRRYSPKYGWGKIDADRFVTLAQDNWKLLKPQSWYYAPKLTVKESIEGENSIESHFTITENILQKANLDHVEQLTVTVNIEANRRGWVSVTLISPNGIVSELGVVRKFDRDLGGFPDWTFSSVAHWDEKAVGDWTLVVKGNDPGSNITFNNWQLKLFGESIDETKAKRFNIDEDYSTINSEEDPVSSDTTTAITASKVPVMSDIVSTATTTNDAEKASSFVRTSDVQDATTTTSTNATLTSTATNIEPTNSSNSSETENKGTDSNGSQGHTHDDSIGDGEEGSYPQGSTDSHYEEYMFFFLVIGFIVCIWLLKNRRSPGRARRREEYEFDIIQPEDDHDLDHTSFQTDDDEFDSGLPSTSLLPSRNSLDATKAKQVLASGGDSKKQTERDYQKKADADRQKLFDTFHGVDSDHEDGDGMYRITDEDDDLHR